MDMQKIFNLVDEKINTLLEQGVEAYSASVAIAEIKGTLNIAWTTCAKTRCERMPSIFQKKACKFECQRSAYQDAITRVLGQRSSCNRTANPQACFNTLDNTAKGMRNKIALIAKQIDATRKQEALSRTKTPGAVGGAGVAPGGAQGVGI
jgi:hypothetical protein